MASPEHPIASRFDWLIETPFAHRGWHDIGQHVPENSLSAFDAAIAAGYGIELDVRPTYDNNAVVFHDASLERLTDEDGQVEQMDSTGLTRIRLRHSDQTIVTLEQALQHIRGRTPVLIEAKSGMRDPTLLCLPIRRALEGYRGAIAVMAFDPRIVGWFADHSPSFVRGLVVSDDEQVNSSWLGRLGIARQLALWKSRPDFLACDVRSIDRPFVQSQRSRGRPVLAWTVRNDADQALADRYADNIIFEGERTLVPTQAISAE
jgi:glycerophosphoryl diester phosphodiesterase